MKIRLFILTVTVMCILAGCGQGKNNSGESRQHADSNRQNNKDQSMENKQSGYASLPDGLNMYYEIHGNGQPLVLIHGGGSTIETTFGRILPALAEKRQVIAVELQGHGRTADLDRPETFQQDADDVAALLKFLGIDSADFFGFSNGGQAAMQIAISHPAIVRRLILASTFFSREGVNPEFWEFIKGAELENMPQGLKDAYKKVAPYPEDLVKMHDKDRDRMIGFKGWTEQEIRSIKAPAYIMISDQDLVKPEHAVAMYRMLPHSRIAILPGPHGAFLGEAIAAKPGDKTPGLVADMVEDFLNGPASK